MDAISWQFAVGSWQKPVLLPTANCPLPTVPRYMIATIASRGAVRTYTRRMMKWKLLALVLAIVAAPLFADETKPAPDKEKEKPAEAAPAKFVRQHHYRAGNADVAYTT